MKLHSAYAYNSLALMYQNGRGVKKNYKKAIEYYHRCIELKESNGMKNLADMYGVGIGVKKDLNKAIELYEKALEYDDSGAYIGLAQLYRDNIDVLNEKEKIIEFCESAVRLNNSNGYTQMGCFYDVGDIFEKESSKAYEYYEKAVEMNSNTIALYNIARMSEYGIGCTVNFEKAAEYYQKCANLHNAHGLRGLARLYNEGKGVQKDIEKSIELYEEAIKERNTQSMNELADIYVTRAENLVDPPAIDPTGYTTQEYAELQSKRNRIVESNAKKKLKNYQKAFSLYNDAVKHGDAEAMYNLASLYLEGRGVNENNNKVTELLRTAIKKRHSDSMVLLAYYYYYGTLNTVPQDRDEAVKYYQMAIDTNNNSVAYYYLGNVFRRDSERKDINRSIELFSKGSQNGYLECYFCLGEIFKNGENDVEKNLGKALSYYHAGSDGGNGNCSYSLGNYYKSQSLLFVSQKYFRIALKKKCDYVDLITDDLRDLEDMENVYMKKCEKKMFQFEADVIFIYQK
jgi:uncharacterized protein